MKCSKMCMFASFLVCLLVVCFSTIHGSINKYDFYYRFTVGSFGVKNFVINYGNSVEVCDNKIIIKSNSTDTLKIKNIKVKAILENNGRSLRLTSLTDNFNILITQEDVNSSTKAIQNYRSIVGFGKKYKYVIENDSGKQTQKYFNDIVKTFYAKEGR